MDCTEATWIDVIFKFAGWIATVAIAVAGFIITSRGWEVTGRQSLSLAKQTDINETIKTAVSLLDDFADSTLSFWTEADTKVRFDQLITKHYRIVITLKQIAALKGTSWPKEQVSELRKLATLNIESCVRPMPFSEERIQRIIRVTNKLIDCELLHKEWKDFSV